jgi:hypothetical protein
MNMINRQGDTVMLLADQQNNVRNNAQNNAQNNDLNAYLLRLALNAYHAHDHQALRDMGLDICASNGDTGEAIKALLDRAKTMNASIFAMGCGFRIADVTFNPRLFSLMMDYAERESELNALINKLISLGASQSMMEDLTGIDGREYRARRNSLGLPPGAKGRPHALSEDQIACLYDAHRQCQDGLDEMNRYLFLGETTNLPLAQIWSHMKQMAD